MRCRTGADISVGSVAIGAIPTAICQTYNYLNDTFYSNNTVITTDQRGTDRPQGATCDVGAYEAPSIAVTTTPASPDPTTGWFNADTLSAYSDQVTVQLTANGMAEYETVRCGSTGVMVSMISMEATRSSGLRSAPEATSRMAATPSTAVA